MGLFWGVSLRFAVWCCFGFGEEMGEIDSCDLCCFLFRWAARRLVLLHRLSCIIALRSGCFLDLVLVKSITGCGQCSYCTLLSPMAPVRKPQNIRTWQAQYLDCSRPMREEDPDPSPEQLCSKCHTRKKAQQIRHSGFVGVLPRYSMYKSIQR